MPAVYLSAMRKGYTTVRQIAELLNLSPATVSRSLRGHPDIGLETRTRIIETAHSLGYTPRKYVRSSTGLRPIRNLHVAVLIGCMCGRERGPTDSSFVGYHFQAAVNKVSDARRGTASTIFMDSGLLWKKKEKTEIPEEILNNQCDGIILAYPFPQEYVAILTRIAPVISLEYSYNMPGVDTISPSQARDTTRAVEKLVAMGHRRIGYISDANVGNNKTTQALRFAGYLTGLSNAGLVHDPEYVIGFPYRNYDVNDLPELVKSLWFMGVTAMVCSIDRHAYQLWRDMPRLGIEIPEDLSLVGVNGVTPMHDLPQLATYRMPYEVIVTAALERIAYRKKYPATANIYVEYESAPVPGKSTRKPREELLNRHRARI